MKSGAGGTALSRGRGTAATIAGASCDRQVLECGDLAPLLTRLAAFDLATADDPLLVLGEALASEGPALINVPIDPAAHVYPMVPPGAANKDMIGGERALCYAAARG